MQGRTLIERASLIAFIIALSAVVLVFISRNSSAESPRVQHENAPVSEALGLNTRPNTVTAPSLAETMMAADRIHSVRGFVARLGLPPEPTFAETLVAAAEVQRARDFYVGIGAAEPEPSLAEILVAADQVQRAREFFTRAAAAAEPTLAQILIAADQLTRARDRATVTTTQPTLEEALIAADILDRFARFVEAASAPPAPPAPIATVPPPPPPPDTPVPPPTSTAVPPPPPAITAPPQDDGAGWYDYAFETEIFAVINNKRTEAGLSAMVFEPHLTQAAKDYARVLADFNWFSHTGPDGSDLVSRTEAAGFPFTVQIGEVIAWGSDGWPPDEIVQAWLDSPSHREQVMSGIYTRAGIGCYFTDEGTLMVRCVMDLAE